VAASRGSPYCARTSRFASTFPARSSALNRLGRKGVARRIPPLDVDPVQNPREIRRAIPQDAVEPETEVGRLDLLGVRAAHGRYDLGVSDAALSRLILPQNSS